MGMTMTQKILAMHVGREFVEAGDLLVSQVDLILANDITGPPAINEFEKIGRPVFDKDKIALVPDHFSPCKDQIGSDDFQFILDLLGCLFRFLSM